MPVQSVVKLKRWVKELLLSLGAEAVVRWYWRRMGKLDEVRHLAVAGRAERFRSVYKDNVWSRDHFDAPPSGPGSSIKATSRMRDQLPRLLDSLSIDTLLDVGCGDMTWMSETPIRQRYIGIDIVPELIRAAQDKHASDLRSFKVIDVCESIPPRADAALCREVLFHLSFVDTRRALENIKRSGATYLLATSDPSLERNNDISTGDFRDINLVERPYSLGEPISFISDGDGPNPHRIIGVWKL